MKTRNYLQKERRNVEEKIHAKENDFDNIWENTRTDKVELNEITS